MEKTIEQRMYESALSTITSQADTAFKLRAQLDVATERITALEIANTELVGQVNQANEAHTSEQVNETVEA